MSTTFWIAPVTVLPTQATAAHASVNVINVIAAIQVGAMPHTTKITRMIPQVIQLAGPRIQIAASIDRKGTWNTARPSRNHSSIIQSPVSLVGSLQQARCPAPVQQQQQSRPSALQCAGTQW